MTTVAYLGLLSQNTNSANGQLMLEVPKASISNGIITVELYLPEKSKGFYRSTRFDWSGVIYKLEYKGHEYFGQWFNDYDPKKHDAICGPVDEFGAVGYEEAKVGNPFLKIGVGMLIKPDDAPYSSFKYYKIENSGKRYYLKQVIALSLDTCCLILQDILMNILKQSN